MPLRLASTSPRPSRPRALGKLGIRRLLGLEHFVRDLEQSRRFYVDCLGFSEVGRSSPDLERSERQRSLAFQAGDIVVLCTTPLGEGGSASRFLAKHPDGIGAIVFEVDDIRRAFALLEDSGGTPLSEIGTIEDDTGCIDSFSITTPFGDTTFRFVERRGYSGHFPGVTSDGTPGGRNENLGLWAIDHVTTNFSTMKPALLWLEHVLGFEPLWEVEFHTGDGNGHETEGGSGLRSKVLWDPGTGIKFANNEPRRPFFGHSQISQFCEEHRGDGVQHVALATQDILGTVRALRARGVAFMPTPPVYYDRLETRLAKVGLRVDESVDALRELGILVDGSGPSAYLLQIFLRDSASLHGNADSGPFFFELIQRKGDAGFGAGNFRALFESIERRNDAVACG